MLLESAVFRETKNAWPEVATTVVVTASVVPTFLHVVPSPLKKYESNALTAGL